MYRFAWALALYSCACCLSSASAQTTVSGRVTDATSGEPLVGAGVYFSSASQRGASTDADGRYELAVPGQDPGELCVSYVAGDGVQCSAYNGAGVQDLAIALNVALDEVVVTALGLERGNAELGYAVQQLDGGALSDVPSTNFLDTLAGQLAGVTVVTGPTGVGSSSLVSIRGEASFTRNTPLYVVDGVPIDNRSVINVTDEASQGFQEVDFGGGAPEVSPYDVESVSVLKGPAAAALYGTRAANGVIIVNTKPGGAATGLGVEVNSQTTFDRPFRLPEFQNRYGQGRAGEFVYVDGAGGGIQDGITFSYGPELDAGTLVPQFDSPVRLADGTTVRAGDLSLYDGLPIEATPFVSHPDNVRDLYRTGVTAHNQIALSQGFSGGEYRLSFTDMRADSYLPGVNLDRNNVAARLSFRPADRLRVSAGATYVNTRSDNRPASGYGSENLNYSTVAWLGRSTDLGSLRDYWQPGLEGREQFSYNVNFFDNPFFILQENRNSLRRDRLFGYLQASVDLTAKLELRLRTGLDNSTEARELRRAFSTNRFRRGAYAENDVSFRELNTEALLTYTNEVGDLRFAVSAGANRLAQTAETQQTQAEALTTPGVYRLSNTAIPLVTFGQLSERRINSVYGLARLGWREQVFVDVTGRNDWSSALATPTSASGTSFFYPSVSASWLVSEAAFPLPRVISYFQVRASAAQVGNDTDPYRTGGTFLPGTPVNGAPTYTAQAEIPADSLRPERATAFEVGADVRFWEDRFGVDVTAYTQLNEDQILALPTPISSGYETRVVNGGAVRANGLEVVGSVRGLRFGGVRYDGHVNFTAAYARVESLPEGVERTTLAYSRVYNNPGQTVYFIAEEGGRIGDLWGTSYLRNEAGQYVLDARGRFIADNTLRKLGNYTSDFEVGLANRITWRGLSLDLLLDWRQGGELVSRTQALAGYSGQLALTANRPADGIVIPGVTNVGTAEAPSYQPNTTAISAEDYYIAYYNREHEEHNTLDASFLKVRELRVGYAFAEGGLRYVQGLELALVGRNLYAWSPIEGIDPEQFAVQGQRFVRGVEDMSYPTPRSLGVSLSAKF